MTSHSLKEEDVIPHNSKEDLWLILDGEVYDLTSYVDKHPGGDAILRNAGHNATKGFHSVQAHKYVQGLIKQTLTSCRVGMVQQTPADT